MPTIFDKFDLTGQTAIVTGGIGLLGSGFSRTLAEAGATVIIADLDDVKTIKKAEELQQDGYKAIGVGVDVTDKASVESMVATAVDHTGRCDILVCSAAMDPKFDNSQGTQHNNSFEDFPLDGWNMALGVNLTGLFLCAQAAAKPMVQQNHGVIINICSTYGLNGPDQRIYERPGQPPRYKPVYYSVTKAGVLGLTRYLAAYYAGKNMRANALTPGGVYNDHDELFEKNYSYRTIMGRMAEKDEMNGALLFLASDASSYMTGSNLVVDGGWTAW
ncbi:MAG: SDR family oxidoreductase [Anaerolineae bacterium]|jgi:2-deoxy-D-gluconate 3-dehydrogenase|nr:SDR family oxidoreductase [Anaerolineae bacterium]